MFRIKICGVRLKNDVAAVEKSPADAVGINFFPPSVRYMNPDSASTAELISAAKDAGLRTVGVFVNVEADRLLRLRERLGLDALQLHGDEPLELANRLTKAGCRVVRAIKLPRGAQRVETIEAATEPWIAAGAHLLIDADAGSAHGGSGHSLDWQSLREWSDRHPEASWTLAGGLKPENVGEAIRLTNAASVDVASGVESRRGEKSAERIQRFAETADAELSAMAAGGRD